MKDRPPSKTTGFWFAVIVRGTLLVRKASIFAFWANQRLVDSTRLRSEEVAGPRDSEDFLL
jgi:hypothetical protein